MTLTPSDDVWSFLGELASARARWALRCPAITVEAAKNWGTEFAAELRDEIRAGTFTKLDGKPCLVECAPAPGKPAKQLRLGEEAA